jgi:hypothetical protein
VAEAPDPTPIRIVALSTKENRSQSLFRFYNSSTVAGQVHVTLADLETGERLVHWISPSIEPGASPQFSIAEMEASTGVFEKPLYYSAAIYSGMEGHFAHVLWQRNGTLSNITTCSSGPTQILADHLLNVHSSRLDPKYPSQVLLTNTGTRAERPALGLYDAATGRKLGVYQSGEIAPRGGKIIPIEDIESGARYTPLTTTPHYVVKVEGPFSGFIQHRVHNLHTSIVVDMTNTCPLSN